METGDLPTSNVHHGYNIRRIRREKGISQLNLSERVNLSQQTVSRFETVKEIDDEMLQRFSKALDVPVEYLKTLEEDKPTIILESNTINNSDNTYSNIGNNHDNDNTNNFNPVEKIVELYERMLEEEKRRNDLLEKRLEAIEQSLKNK